MTPIVSTINVPCPHCVFWSWAFYKMRYDRCLEFLEFRNLLFTGLFGFWKQHSLCMALMILMDLLIWSLDKVETAIGIFLVFFSKPFDTVGPRRFFCIYGGRGCVLIGLEATYIDIKTYDFHTCILKHQKYILWCSPRIHSGSSSSFLSKPVKV